MNQKTLIKSFNNFETKIDNNRERVDSNVLPTDPKWLKYCPPIYRQRVRERIEEKKLFEERKKLFNAIKPKLSGGGLDRSTKHLIRKVDPNQPNSLSSEVQRLIVKRFQNTQEWIKERKQKEEAEQEEVKKLISEVWKKENYGNN